MSKRVLITGGYGYLGGRIAVELANNPEWIVRLSSRKAQAAPSWLPQAETVAMDVQESGSLPAAMTGVQAVVHLAAMNENECVTDPGRAVLINTLGTLNALQAAIDAGVKQFIYFSTAHVYGVPLVGNITEQTLPRPIHPYAITHHAAEDFVLAAYDQKKITGIVVRLSNGFGAPMHPDVDRWTLLVSDLCRQAVTNRNLSMRSSGLQRRDFVTLHDVGRVLSHVIDLPKERLGNGIFNVGGAWAPRIIDMAELVQSRCSAVLGFTPEIVCPKPDPSEVSLGLNYCIDKLLATGFTLTGDPIQEIDTTLLLCHDAYANPL